MMKGENKRLLDKIKLTNLTYKTSKVIFLGKGKY